jgi:hydrogenase maturation factor
MRTGVGMCLSDLARIRAVTPDGAEAVAEIRGADRRLSLALLVLDGGEAVRPGDWVLASAGLALERLDEATAREHMTFLDHGKE